MDQREMDQRDRFLGPICKILPTKNMIGDEKLE